MAYTVITGASGGLGEGISLAFAKRGHDLILTGRSEKGLLAVKEAVHQVSSELSCLIYPLDLSDEEALRSFFAFAEKKGVETWINNAGLGYRGESKVISEERFKAIFEVNIYATALLSHLFIKAFSKGTLINVASSMGYCLSAQASLYSASKFFITSLTEGLYYELEKKGSALRLKLYAPSAIKTNFSYVAGGLSEADYDKVFSRYHTKEEAGEQVYTLYQSEAFLGLVLPSDYEFQLLPPQHAHFVSKSYQRED